MTTTETPTRRTPEEIERLVSNGNAPVKLEYMKERIKVVVPPRPAPGDAPTPGQRSDGGVDKQRTGKSNKQKKRERQEEKKLQICTAFARGNCAFGDECRFNHNLDVFLQSKEKDLPGCCPFSSVITGCPYGVLCRFYSTHRDAKPLPEKAVGEEESSNTAEEVETIPFPEVKEVLDETNVFGLDLKEALRKRNYRFPKADKLLKEMQVAVHHKGAQPKKEEAKEAPEGQPPPTKRPRTDGTTEPEPTAPERAEGAEGTASRLRPGEKKLIDFRGKLYLAPLTTVGNLPFRRVCKGFGVDITIGEMAMATNLLQGHASEWALLRRHPSEDLFGVQVCGGYPDSLGRCAELLNANVAVDFVDVNMGCPIDLVCNKGAGSSLLQKPKRIEQICKAMSPLLDCPLTVKLRKGYYDNHLVAHDIIPQLRGWGAAGVTLHGRTRQQRYTRRADWDYIGQCAQATDGLQLIGNGDIFSYKEYTEALSQGVATTMVARGALVKPWVFTEIKEQREWDISGSERFDMLKSFASMGLEHWGSDSKGVENTRRFLLEWMSFLWRYIPVGLLEKTPAQLHWRPPSYIGRDDRETLLGSDDPEDWVKVSKMLLGPTPSNYKFVPKHKSNSYADKSEAGAAIYDGEQNG